MTAQHDEHFFDLNVGDGAGRDLPHPHLPLVEFGECRDARRGRAVDDLRGVNGLVLELKLEGLQHGGCVEGKGHESNPRPTASSVRKKMFLLPEL